MAKGPGLIPLPQLVALEARFCGIADWGSADCNEGCFCDDAGGFVVKTNKVTPTLAHSEWFCSSVAAACGIPQVGFSVIHHTDGSYCFGSSYVKGKIKDWWTLAEQGAIDFGALADDLTKIYALDLFIHNDDRHMNNYMVVQDGNGHRVSSFDYSRSWLHHAFPMTTILKDPQIATVGNKEWFKAKFGNYLVPATINDVLDRVSALTAQQISQIIARHPKDWLTQAQEDAIMTWWDSGQMLQRVNDIKAGVTDGSLL